MQVLWLTPDKPANISVGRKRIAEQLRKNGIAVTLRGTTPRTVFDSLRERDRYDVVIGTTRAGAFAGAVLKLLGTPLVIDHVDPIRQFRETHSRLFSLAVRFAENAAFALADHVLYVYEEEHDRVSRYANAASETDLGVDFDRFANPSTEIVEHARKRLAAAGVADEQVAIYVGGLEPIYHIEELLPTMRHLDDWTLVVLGAGSLKGRVERAAREQENIIFLGTVAHEQIPGYLHAADIGICLVNDSHTLKVLEYAAAGLSVVQASGRAEERLGAYVEFCEAIPRDIARAVRQAGEHGASEEFQEYVRRFDYKQVAEQYAQVIDS